MKKLLLSLSLLAPAAAMAQVAGYSFHHENGMYNSITEPMYNAAVQELNVQDDYLTPYRVAMPFAFRFAGQPVDSVNVHANGYIWFGSAVSGLMTWKWPISALQPPSVKGVVSAYGMDCHPLPGGSNSRTRVRTGLTGTAPARMFVVEWEALSREENWNSTPDTISFQIRLYESSNRVEINYGPCILSTGLSTQIEVGIKGATYDDYNNRIFNGIWNSSLQGNRQTDRTLLRTTNKPEQGQLLVWENWQPVPTAVPGTAAAGNIRLFPQPAGNRLHVSGEGIASSNWRILDMSGKVLRQGRLDADSGEIPTAALAPGNYVLELRKGSQSTSRQFTR